MLNPVRTRGLPGARGEGGCGGERVGSQQAFPQWEHGESGLLRLAPFSVMMKVA